MPLPTGGRGGFCVLGVSRNDRAVELEVLRRQRTSPQADKGDDNAVASG